MASSPQPQLPGIAQRVVLPVGRALRLVVRVVTLPAQRGQVVFVAVLRPVVHMRQRQNDAAALELYSLKI